MTTNDYSRIISEESYNKDVKYSLVQHYFRGHLGEEPECLGLEVIIPSNSEKYTHTVGALEPTFCDWSLIHKYFEENPNSHHCYYPYTKNEIDEIIKRLEYIKDSMDEQQIVADSIKEKILKV